MNRKSIVNYIGGICLVLLSGVLFAQENDPLAEQLSSDALDVFDLAEELFPSLFADRSELRQAQGYIYRFYAASNVYIGIRDGSVWVLGGPFGNSATNRGTISVTRQFLVDVRTEREAEVEVPDVEVPVGTGNFTLTISGTFSLTATGLDKPTPVTLTVEDVPAPPNPDDFSAIETEINNTIGGLDSVSNIQIVTINNTEDRITFTVSFNATGSGFGINYDLEYDYVR